MGFNITYFMDSLQSGLVFLPRTLLLVGIPIGLGLLLGTVLAAVRVYHVPFWGRSIGLWVTVYQGLPIVVALLIYNLLFMSQFNTAAGILHLPWTVAQIDNLWVGVFALSLQAICLMEESIRGAFYAVEQGQREAGVSVGLTEQQTLRRILLPQMIPVAIPMLLNNVVGTVKNSSVVVAIGVTEVLAGATVPASKTYSFLESYVAAGVIYWGLTAGIERIVQHWERPARQRKKHPVQMIGHWLYRFSARVYIFRKEHVAYDYVRKCKKIF